MAASGPRDWEGFVEHVRQGRPLLASILENGICAELPSADSPGPDSVIALFYNPDKAYYKEQLQSRTYADQLQAFLRAYFGRPLLLKIELKDAGESLAGRKEREARERQAAARAAVESHPIIREARSLFGGTLGPIELAEREAHG